MQTSETADLLNRSLKPKGITAKTSLSGDCLMLTTEAKEAPDQVAIADFVRKGMTSLNSDAIKRVIIRGQATGSKAPKWRETLNLNGNVVPSPMQVTEPESSPVSRFGFINKLRSLNVPAAVNSLLLLGILITTTLGAVAPKKPAAVQWEYKIEAIDDSAFDSLMRIFGEQGWEVASARRATSGEGDSTKGLYEVIFKRPTYVSEREIAARQASEGLYAKELGGQIFVRAVLLSEQTHYLDKSQFAPSISDLGLDQDPETEDYKFDIALEDAAKVVVTGTAKVSKLKSFTGVVYATTAGEATTLSLLCATDKPSRSTPQSPQVENGTATCPSGTSEVKSE